MRQPLNEWRIQCECGHVDGIDAFTHTPIRGPLPLHHYQCPKCGRAWAVEMRSTVVVDDGYRQLPKIEIVRKHPVL